jgi:hypothetical protein
LTDITGLIRNVDSQDGATRKQKRKSDEEMKEKDRVKERVKSWERERERLREMERLEAYEQEREDELEKALCDDWSLLSKSESPPSDSYNGRSSGARACGYQAWLLFIFFQVRRPPACILIVTPRWDKV